MPGMQFKKGIKQVGKPEALFAETQMSINEKKNGITLENIHFR
jgi:hypothetical protein